MALPKSIRPEYTTTIPSTGKKVKYQPFSVREEKVLILAAESGEQDEITNAIINTLERCVTSPSDFKVSDLALFDIEYLFLKTRAKSAGEKVTVTVTDPNDTSYSVEHEINIDSIKVIKDAEHTNLIELDEGVSVKMNYPGISFFAEGVNIENVDESIGVVSKCVSQIIIGDEVYNKVDMTVDEITEWVEGLTTDQFQRIMGFFNTAPKLQHKIKLKNKKTGNDFEVVLEGLQDFF
jgi:hypothetical protein